MHLFSSRQGRSLMLHGSGRQKSPNHTCPMGFGLGKILGELKVNHSTFKAPRNATSWRFMVPVEGSPKASNPKTHNPEAVLSNPTQRILGPSNWGYSSANYT